MSHATTTADGLAGQRPVPPSVSPNQMLMIHESTFGRRSATMFVSAGLHTLLLLTVTIVPLLFYDALPPQDALKAFFVQPLEIAPPPPPPPPPPPRASPASVVRAAPRVVDPARGFVAPIEVPSEVKPEEGIDLGIEGGVPGGVEGGVPGGVVGGVVGGLPTVLPPPPPPRVVRIGGRLAPPRIVRKVEPVYPPLATAARLSGVVILEAEVDAHGAVKTVKVLSGHALFDEAAVEAVRQWRYQPLLLNGEPTGFILSVVITFNLMQSS
jgi:protein TonB